MRVEKVSISELKPHPKNPRIHPESAIKKLERSIREFGWTNPILVSADGYILAGHASWVQNVARQFGPYLRWA